MSTPRLRRIVACTPRSRSRAAKRAIRSDSAACPPNPPVGFSGIRLTWAPPRKPAQGSASASAWCGWSLTPAMHAYSNVTRRPLAVGVLARGVEHLGDRVAAVERDELARAARRRARGARPRASPAAGTRARRRMPGTTPTVDTVRWRAEMPTSSCRRSSDSSTGSTLASGSPMPMNTTLRHALRRRVLGAQHLLDDLAGVEVALEAGLAGRAERAAHRAAGLRRDAHRGPVRVAHEHGLDLGAVGARPRATWW